MENKEDFDKRARARALAADFAEQGDSVGWFEALYKESEGDLEKIPWGDLKPNAYFEAWSEKTHLKATRRKALVVGCGLGDDAVYLDDLGFDVTAFDISPTAIEWAKRLHADRNIQFEVADLFEPYRGWLNAFDFVLEIYTIQPLPLEIRSRVIDAIAGFVAPGGELVVVTRGRDNDAEPERMPWPVSRKDLSQFEANALEQISFDEMPDETDDEPCVRFVGHYRRPRS